MRVDPDPRLAGTAGSSGPNASTSDAPVASGERLALRVPGYRIEDMLGRGGMGIVYRARQLSIGRHVAIKVLPVRASRRPRFVERFLSEAKAVARLNHPNVVQAIDAGEACDLCYFVMELVDGETAGDRVERDGALPLKDAVAILLGVARALEHASRHGLVHRDVKPDNVMLAKDGRVLLCDLGLARAGASLTEDGPTERSDIAEGTPAYMAPEQARGFQDVDIRADLYALGVTAYHLLTGELPFDGEDPIDVMEQHVHAPFPRLDKRRRDAPKELCKLVERLTQKTPQRRPQDPAEVVRELARLQARLAREGGGGGGGERARGAKRRRDGDGAATGSSGSGVAAVGAAPLDEGGHGLLWLAAALSFAAAVLTWWALFGPLADPPPTPAPGLTADAAAAGVRVEVGAADDR